ncbi:hypothetical protein ACQEVC_45325 [Plantactinospora sp. CA-294935]|uniref:hypothetical protein n=1 Tax=Plantactinospora sp. CA-294935 TaxID=3240012 RepID=UPI003D93604E
MGRKGNTADQKANAARNAEMVEAAGRLAGGRGIHAASAHIGATQGHKARMAALKDVLRHRTH